MVITDRESNVLLNIFLSQRLNRMHSLSIIAELSRLETENGIAFVVKRLKCIKAALLSGDLTGIKLNSKGLVKGPWGVLFKKAALSRKDAIRMDRVARVYGRWVSKPATEEQWSAYRSSIAKRRVKGELPTIMLSDQDRKIGKWVTTISHFQEHIPLSDVKRAPFLGIVTKNVTPEEHFYTLLDYCPHLVYRHRNVFSKLWKADYSVEMVLVSRGHRPFWDHHNEIAGKICCLTKDRGLKLRFIANPLIGLQIATSRLQQACDVFLKALPESCVHDQLSIIEWVIPKLKNGEKAWSIDLTSATDSFPLKIQIQVLTDLFPDLIEDINLFKDISLLDWETPFGPARFGSGQPMGLAPSFAAFSVTHILLIRSLGGNSDNFRTCGDDVVIFDEKLAIAYMETLKLIGVEISLSKSLLGDSKVEFAGRIIDKYGPWRSYKAAFFMAAKDPLGLIRQYGLSGLPLVPKDLRPLVRFFSTLPLIGFEGLADHTTLECLDEELVEQLYFLRSDDIFPIPQANEKLSRFSIDPNHPNVPPYDSTSMSFRQYERFLDKPLYEGFPLQESLVGPGVSNNPVLVEHVRINTPKTTLVERMAFIDGLARDLKVGFQSSFGEDSEGNFCEKAPLSRLKRLFKKINTLLER